MDFPSLRVDTEGLKRELGCPQSCQHGQTEIRRKIVSGGRSWFWNQCVDCGKKIGDRISARTISDHERIPLFDEELSKRVWDAYYAMYKKRDAEERIILKDRWNRLYSDYLKSEEWAQKRMLVFERANGICEGCRKKRAAEVHHTTYQNVGQEFLFELVALCGECHRRYHEKIFPGFLENLWFQGYGRREFFPAEPGHGLTQLTEN